jgi:hypothetical protein
MRARRRAGSHSKKAAAHATASPKAAYRQIRETAVTGDRKPHDVIMDGVDLVPANGFPFLAEFIPAEASPCA